MTFDGCIDSASVCRMLHNDIETFSIQLQGPEYGCKTLMFLQKIHKHSVITLLNEMKVILSFSAFFNSKFLIYRDDIHYYVALLRTLRL